MAENRIEFEVVADTSQADQSFQKLGNTLGQAGDEAQQFADQFGDSMGDMGQEAQDAADAVTDAQREAQKALEQTQEEAQETGKALQGTGEEAEQAGKRTQAGTAASVKNLGDLQDSAALTSSSMGQLGSAVGVLNPQLGGMLSATGALSGGLEGAAKMGGGFSKIVGSMTSPIGLVTTGLIAGGLALFAWSKRSKGAKIDTEALEGAIDALDAAQKRFMTTEIELSVLRGETTQLRAELEHLGRTMEDEFADKLEAVNAPFAEFQEEVDKAREKLAKFQAEQFGNTSSAEWNYGQAISASASKAGKELDQLSTAFVNAEMALADALKGESEAAVARRELIAGIEEEEKRRREILELRIKADEEARRASDLLKAQADNDAAAIRKVSFEMAVQGDAVLTNKLTWARWAESTAESLAAHKGFASGVLNFAADALRARSEAIREEIEAETEFSTIFQENLRGMQSSIAATDALAASEANLASLREQAADRLASVRGAEAEINRQYAKDIAEINNLLAAGAVTQEEAAELIEAAVNKQSDAEQELINQRQTRLNEERNMREDARQAALQTMGFAVTERQAITDEEKAKIKELEGLYAQGLISFQEFQDAKTEAERKASKQRSDLAFAEAQQNIASVELAMNAVQGLFKANFDMLAQQLDQQEEAALARAEGNADKQAEIQKEFAAKRREKLGQSWRLQKALEIAGVWTSAASASMAALALPPVGLGPVAGPFLIPFIAATAAAQTAMISQQNPPFHQGGIVGGSPGDQSITAQSGEVVLNRNAVANMGGADAANSLNNGAGFGAPLVVQLTYKQRMFDRVVVDNLAKSGPLKRAINKAKNAGKRGRVGGRL